MFLIVSPYLIPKKYRGFTLFPFVFIKYALDRDNQVLINHERIHLRQQLELLILPFLIWYFLEFLLRLIQYKNWDLAYRNVCFEKEAYVNEKNISYLNKRKHYNFLKYL